MLRVRSIFTGVAGAPYYSNLYFPGLISTDAQDRVNEVATAWDGCKTLLRTPMSIQVEGFVPVIDEVSGDITGSFTVTEPAPVGCVGTQEAMPPANQMLMRLSTPTYFAGRRLQGRMFIPGLTEASNDSGGVVSPNDSAVILDAFEPITTGPDRIGVWSRKNGAFVQVDGVSIWNQWSVLRSRRD